MSAALRLVAEQALDPEVRSLDEAAMDQLARSGGYIAEQLLRLPIPAAYAEHRELWVDRMMTLADDLANARPKTALQYRYAGEIWQDALRAGVRPQ
jgi:hypothetical protein